MHDPKFEKEVQQKMQELEFVPSDEVWANIQQGIAPRERRRAVALFWWWLVPGALLLGWGLLTYRHSVSTPVVAKAAVRGADESGSRGSAAGKGDAASKGRDAVKVGAASKGSAGDIGTANAGVVRDEATGGAVGAVKTGMAGSGVKGRLASSRVNAEKRDGATDMARVTGTKGKTGRTGKEGMTETEGTTGTTGMTRALFESYRPGLIGGFSGRRGVTAARPFTQPANTAVSGIRETRRPWVAGFAAGGGVSSIQSAGGSGLSNGSSYAFNSQLPASAQVRSSITNSGSKETISNIQSGVSYWAGVYGEKKLSARWSVDIGLNLHFYSAELKTNQQVSAYAPTSASLLAPSVVTYTLASQSSIGGTGEQTYLNRYYFLELPAAVQWQINRSRKLPVYWRGGAVLSYRMASNALYYSEQTGDYEKDNAVARKMQIGLQSGFMVELPVRGVRLQAGPEVQYALTSLLTTPAGGGHLFYGGLRVALTR